MGAVALAAIGTTTVSAEPLVVTSSHIGQLKSMLQLTPAQERYWPPVEAALRNASGLTGIRRAWSAAQPLIRVLDAEQKEAVRSLARSLGIGRYAAL